MLVKLRMSRCTVLLGTLRFATARGYYGYIRSKSLPVTSPRELQYGFPAVASFSAVSNCLLCRTLEYGFSEKPTSKTKYLVILRYSLGIIASLFKRKLKGFGYLIIMVADKKAS